MTASEEFGDLLGKSGVSLASLGVRDIGLSRSNALRAVEILRHGKLSILGGDVYFRRGDRVEVAYANWYADPKPEEDRETYLLRSWDKAEEYLKNFPEAADAEVLFAIVVEKAPGADIRSTVNGNGKRQDKADW
jgi:hypothetical protein